MKARSKRQTKTKTHRKSTVKKQVTVKQRKDETVLGKIKDALGGTADKIKTLLAGGKSDPIKKRTRTVSQTG